MAGVSVKVELILNLFCCFIRNFTFLLVLRRALVSDFRRSIEQHFFVSVDDDVPVSASLDRQPFSRPHLPQGLHAARPV
jgi:hypothetical protein